MELLKDLPARQLDRELDQKAWRFAVQVINQTPDDLEITRRAYDYYHQMMDQWIRTGQRPVIDMDALWRPVRTAEIVPFPKAG